MDPLFHEDRSAMFPVRFPTLRKLLDDQRAIYWQTHEISMAQDKKDWPTLTADEQHFIKMILAFFASSDLIVNKNITDRFENDIEALELKALYNFQKMMEDIHSEMYALMIVELIDDVAERDRLLNAVKTIPIIKKKAEWAEKWIKSDEPYKHRLIAFIGMEGISFSGAFCAIFWLIQNGKMLGLAMANQFISRDEGKHTDTGVEVDKLLLDKAETATVHAIFKELVDIEIEFITSAIPCKLIGMNSDSMILYIKFVANRLLKLLGRPTLYENVINPFPFMDRICLENKTDFFKHRPSEYNKSKLDEDDDASYLDNL
jgi:ribonucleotide reductase beta subunit family protein with ferritin-like domain